MAEKINYTEMDANRGEEDEWESQDYEDERFYHDTFEKLKEIGKELLFNGASRSIKNKDGHTPLDLLNSHEEMLSPGHLIKMRYVLSNPGKC